MPGLRDRCPVLQAIRPVLLYQRGDQARPARLVARAKALSSIAVEELVKEEVIAPVGVPLQRFIIAIAGAASSLITQEQTDKAAREVSGNFFQGQVLAGARGAFHFKIVAVVEIKLLQRFDEEIVNGEPDATTPLGIAPKKFRAGLGRFEPDRMHTSI